jgi:hypothetical protein
MENREQTAIGVAGLVFALAAPTVYTLARLYEVARGGGSDPALVLRAVHTGFYWRSIIAAWAGGVVAITVYALLRNDARALARAPRMLARLAVVLLPLAALSAYLRP